MAAVSGYEATGIAAQQSLLLLSRCYRAPPIGISV